MKRHFITANFFLFLGLASGFLVPQATFAASVALATAPLATSTSTAVKPNLLFVLDNSGSMAWDHMPDDASDGGSAVPFIYGYYGLRSSQCNQVYYDPNTTYLAPVKADGTSYPDATFTGAWVDGFNTGSGVVDLNTSFKASQSLNGDSIGQSAYYYNYSGTQLTQLQQNYNVTTNPFNLECSDSTGSSTSAIAPVNGVKALVGGAPSTAGSGVFTKVRLATAETTTIVVTSSSSSAVVTSIKVNGVEIMSGSSAANASNVTAATNIAARITLNGFKAVASSSGGNGVITITGPASAANYTPVITNTSGLTLTTDVFPDTTATKLTNFANWYSYYRTRMLMMKTAAGQAFSRLDSGYRVGLMLISSSNTPTVNLDTFWDNTSSSLGPVSTQRTKWYNALYSTSVSGSTPLRTALSDAGRYYAGKLSAVPDPVQYSCQQNFSIMSTDGYWNAGDGYQLDGTTAVGNQDGTAPRPMYDGAQATSQWQFTYTRNFFSKVTNSCTNGNTQLKTQPQIGTCSTSSSTGSCVPTNWVSDATNPASTATTCNKTKAPNPTNPVQKGTPVATMGSTGGTSDNLADVAMYYYQTDLRTPALGNCGTAVAPATVGPLCDNNVFISTSDNNLQQHMTTFTLGLGASGWMNYSSSYLQDSTGDFLAVKLGLTANLTATPPVCSWQANGTTCNWPVPGMTGSDGFIANIDDLWHAAVNGHGAYFSATNPATLSYGLSNALAGVNTRKGSAAAAATSTLNPVAGNNSAYFASYTTVDWRGNLESRGINTDTGVVNVNATWCVQDVPAGTCATPPVAQTTGSTTIYNCETPSAGLCAGGVIGFSGNLTSGASYCKVPVAISCTGTMNAKVAALTDTRTIKTANSTGTALINFDSTYAAANPTYFDAAHIGTLSQWTSLDSTQKAKAVGANLVNFLRGQSGYEDRSVNDGPPDNKLYRYRQAVMGDALESQPTFISKPVFSYPYPGYSEPTVGYKAVQSNRAGTVYIGANDGMMHAFAADTGIERWAYVPSMVIPNMWKLADKNYATLHVNFVNGGAITSDVCTANCTNASTAVWKTILVGGLNGGGRGFYALDITDPVAPALLWELTTTAGIGKVTDDDVGFSYGNPVITRKADGTWVVLVTSGYNNTSPGDGKGYLYVLNAGTGAIISKISTGAGSTTTPSGLAKIAGFNIEPVGNAVGYVYGGDLLGNVWRFDVNATSTAAIGSGNVMKFATLFSDTAGASPQPITTTPVLAKVSGKNVVFIGTGKYLETGDLTTTQVQTEYAIMDDGLNATLVNPRNTLVKQTLTNNPDGTATRLASNNTVNFYTGRGWYVDFPETGERVNIDSTLVQGVLLVPTIVPSNTACSPGGHGWLNFLNFKTGGALDSTGLASYKYDNTIVGGNALYVDGNPEYVVVTSDGQIKKSPNIPFPPAAANFTGKRTLWRELIQ